jgi:hypothetical protein
MYRKMEKAIHRNCTSIQPAFSAYRTQPTGKQSIIRKSVKWSRNNIHILHLSRTLYLSMISAWKEVGMHMKPYAYMRVHPRIQANRNIYAYVKAGMLYCTHLVATPDPGGLVCQQ